MGFVTKQENIEDLQERDRIRIMDRHFFKENQF